MPSACFFVKSADGTWNVPATVAGILPYEVRLLPYAAARMLENQGGRHMECACYFDAQRTIDTYCYYRHNL